MTSRWPALAAIALCLAGLVLADQRVRVPDASPVEDVAAKLVAAAASPPDSLGSSWYCAGGLSNAAGDLDHVLVVVNASEADISGELTVYPALPDGFGSSARQELIVTDISVPATSKARVSISELIAWDTAQFSNAQEVYSAVLSEFDQPGVVVEHLLVTPQGRDTGACASRPAPTWHFGAGTTNAGVRDLVAILNPFPGTASVDISFPSDDGIRTPSAYNGLVIPGQSMVLLDIRVEVPSRDQMAMTVQSRGGEIVVERMQIFANDPGPRGSTLTLGAPEASLQWFFPSGRSVADSAESYMVYNPGDTASDLELEVHFDDPNVPVLAQPLSVGPGERVVVYLDENETHPISDVATLRLADGMPESGSYWVYVSSVNEAPVVVERLVTRSAPGPVGATATMGAATAARDQTVPLPDELASGSGDLVILNPAGDTIATFKVVAIGAGNAESSLELELGPRRRAVFPLEALVAGPGATTAIRIQSSHGVIAEVVASGDAGALGSFAIPVADTISVPTLTFIPQ